MNQLSPKRILETPNAAETHQSKAKQPEPSGQDADTLNQMIYRKLFQKFNNRVESPQKSQSPHRIVDLHEVYKMRQEMTDKYDQHVQSKRRHSMRNQNFKQQLQSKSERMSTKIGTQEEPSITLEERRLSKADIQNFLLRVERSQERKERGLSKAASEKSVEQQQWKMSPRSRMIVSRSLDKNAFTESVNSARKSKPLFERLNFSPKINKSDLKLEQPVSERLFKEAQIQLEKGEAMNQELNLIQESIREVVKRAPLTQSLLAKKTKKRINKIFDSQFDTISISEDLIDLVIVLKLLGAIANQTVTRFPIPNHPQLKHNLAQFVLAVLDLSHHEPNKRPPENKWMLNKVLSDDRIKSAAQIVSQPDQIFFTYNQEKRIQQHFAEFAQQLRKKRIQNIRSLTALGSPAINRQYLDLADKQVTQPQNQEAVGQKDLASTEIYKQKRDNYLNQLMETVDDSRKPNFQKRLTQADLRTTVKSQLSSRKSLEKLEKFSGRKSVNGVQASRNIPQVYSVATENQIKTVRNKSRVQLATIVAQVSKTPKRPSLKQTPRQQTDIPTESILTTQFKLYDPAVTIAAHKLLEKSLLGSGRTSQMSTNTSKKQPLTARKKVPVATIINLLEERKPLFVDPIPQQVQEQQIQSQSPGFQSGQDQEGPFQSDISPKHQLPPQLTNAISDSPKPNKNFIKPTLPNTSQTLLVKQILPESERCTQNELVPLMEQTTASLVITEKKQSETKQAEQKEELQQEANKLVIDQHSENDKYSNSMVSQNQGQQMEEQGAKEDGQSVAQQVVQVSLDDDQLLEEQKEMAIQPESKPDEDQFLLQSRFSEISKKSSSKFMSESLLESEKGAEEEFDRQEVSVRQLQNKLTITDIGITNPQPEAQVDSHRPDYMTFSRKFEQNVDADKNQNPVVIVELNESENQLSSVLNLTQETPQKCKQLDFNQEKQLFGSDSGKQTQSPFKSVERVSQKSETAFERFQRLKKQAAVDPDCNVMQLIDKLGVHSSAQKDETNDNLSTKSPVQLSEGRAKSRERAALYVPKHASPHKQSDSKSIQSNHLLVQQDLQPQGAAQEKKNEQEAEPLQVSVEDIQREKPVLFCATNLQETIQQEPVRKQFKTLSFANDLNQAESHQSEQRLSNYDSESAPQQIVEKQVNTPTIEGLPQVQRLSFFEAALNEPSNKYQEQEIKKDYATEPQAVFSSIQTNQAKEIAEYVMDDPEVIEQAQWPSSLEPEPAIEQKDEVQIIQNLKPKETLQGQFQAIKQGFLTFMSRNQEETQLDEKPKATSHIVDQVTDMLHKVQDNYQQTNVAKPLKSHEDEVVDLIKPISDKTTSSFTSNLIKNISDNIPTDMIKSLQSNLPQNSFLDAVTQAQKQLQEGELVSSIIARVRERTESHLKDSGLADYLPIVKQHIEVENPYLKIKYAKLEKTQEQLLLACPDKIKSGLPQVNYVDRMAALIEKLDLEYEEELKSKPKLELKKQPSRRRVDSSQSPTPSGSQPKKKPSEPNVGSRRPSNQKIVPPTPTPIKKSKPEKVVKEKKPASKKTPTPVAQPKEQIKQVKRSATQYHAFPSKIVDAPEIMFFVPSWFQVNGKKKNK